MTTALPLLRFDPAELFVRGSGVSAELLEFVHPQLEVAHTSLLSGDSAADAQLVAQPDRIIADYRQNRQQSELGRILATARRLAEEADRVVVVAGPATLLAVRALVEACCHPYHNELSRAERGGQPRMYFAGDSLDNDALAGLLDLVHQSGYVSGPEGSWGLISIGDAPETKAESAARGMLVSALKSAIGGDPQLFGRRCVSISAPGHALDHFAQDSGCDRFDLGAGAGGHRTTLDAASLLPAATLGIDVRRLLEGAARLNLHFRDRPPAENVVLSYVGACHLLRDQSRAWTPALVAWSDSLRSLARWHAELPAPKLPADRTFSLNLLVDEVRRDRIAIGPGQNGDPCERLPDALAAMVLQGRERATNARKPWAALHLPRLDAPTIGQLFQMFLLTALLAPRLPMVTRSSNSLVPNL